MNVVELFAGCGGAAIGLEAAGMSHQLCVEWNSAACTTLQHAGLPALCHDISKPLPFTLDPSPDVVWASPPCQAWSTAGKRLGANDPRNGWPWTWDRVDELQPRWLMCENVPGMLMHEGGRDNCPGGRPDLCAACYWHEVVLPEARRRFAWVGYRVLNSSAYGVPQHRRRVFLVCGPRPIRWPTPTHCDPDHRLLIAAGLKPWVSVGEALGLDGRVSTACSRPDNPKRRAVEHTEPAAAVVPRGRGYVFEPMGHPEWAQSTEGPAPAVGTKGNAYLSRPAPTCMARDVKGHTNPRMERGRHGRIQCVSDVIFLATGRRRLTTAEQARLMAFPDGWPFYGTKTDKYSQSGNACCPPVVEALGRAVMDADLLLSLARGARCRS
jgi:DNA (cytosine-5)-methyltransferase 1